MEWILRSPQIHSTFSNLGFIHADGYYINENCNAALQTILHNILSEDKYLLSYRRSISFGQNIKKDLIPLLIHAKEDKTIDLLIKIFVNLTVPIECLINVDLIAKNDFGRHTIFEINKLLASAKHAFTDHRATRVIIEFIKKNVDGERKVKLSLEQSTIVCNSLLLLRNILHIPEDLSSQSPNFKGPGHAVQNQILWNIFSQSIDKVLIKLMTVSDATSWGVTMVQLIALLYKDQHVVTLHKLLNIWLEASLSESSEDNESNTSPPDRGSDDSSRMLTSDPTSDSSDTGGSGKSNDEPNSMKNGWGSSSFNNASENDNQLFPSPSKKESDIGEKSACNQDVNVVAMKMDIKRAATCISGMQSTSSEPSQSSKGEKKTMKSENSDCGYGTQIENQESISTSSNEDEPPSKKPVHQKPHNPKQRANNKVRPGVTHQERKRKKIVKRGKTNIINVHGLSYNTPTDNDISNVMKEFTVDFLLKGYNSLVHTLHSQILTNMELEIDKSHFFWLVTYFLKFATQIELDMEHVGYVLSFNIVSYLTAEGANLCEQLELAIKLDDNDLKPSLRRLHLVVTAIREFVQAIEVFKTFTHTSKDDQQALVKLQMKMCESEELRSLLVLLLRHYDPKYYSKQYLQDLIVTNHILLLFLDSVMKLPDYNGTTNMIEHIRQFATPEIMYQYGILLEDFASNGEFVNDCIFTLMHHVGGELDCLITLFQPKILKIFTSIWKSEYEICDDWSDLIEYVINTFIKKPHSFQSTTNFRLDAECFDDDNVLMNLATVPLETKPTINETDVKITFPNSNADADANVSANTAIKDKWTEDELSALSWNYMQCNTSSDVIGEIIKLFKEDDIIKPRDSVIRQLFNRNIINKDEFEKISKAENERSSEAFQITKDKRDDEIEKLCKQLVQDGKLPFLDWVQKVLLETCYAKIYLDKKSKDSLRDPSTEISELKLMSFDWFKKNTKDAPVMSPVAYHSLLLKQSVPLVPWNCLQANICKDLKFLQLLHKLGFHMPVDSGKVFIRIPHFWTTDFLYDVAGKILPIDRTKLKFSLSDLSTSHIPSTTSSKYYDTLILSTLNKNVPVMETSDNVYQIHKQKHFATMVNFTPMPGCSFNTETLDVDKRNWLEVVQKAQEYKLTLNLASHVLDDEDANPDTVMPAPVSNKDDSEHLHTESNNSSQPTISSSHTTILSTPLLIPPTMSIKQETSQFIEHLIESEDCNNSVCETASVASDLTRMYVSDEDEKPELLLAPVPVENDSIVDDQPVDSSIRKMRKRLREDISSTV